MIISVSTGLYYKRHYKEVLDIISKSGAQNIELALNQSFIDVPIEELKEEIELRNGKVTSIHLPLTFIAYERHEDEEFWINKGLKYLDVFRANILVSHYFYRKDDRSKSNDLSHFNLIRKYTKKSGKFVCTENMPNIKLKTRHQNPAELNKFLVDNNCYLTYDTTHVATHGRCILEDYKLYKDHIRNIHLSDYKNGNEHKLLGEGELPIVDLISLLEKDNYPYPVTLEFDFENPSRNKIMSDDEASNAIAASIRHISLFSSNS